MQRFITKRDLVFFSGVGALLGVMTLVFYVLPPSSEYYRQQSSVQSSLADAGSFITYKHESFRINYPTDWTVTEHLDSIIPYVIFSPEPVSITEQDPFPNATYLAIYPKGSPYEPLLGVTRPSALTHTYRFSRAEDFPLVDDSAWASYVAFAAQPASWGPSGHLFLSTKVDGLVEWCGEQGDDACDPLFSNDVVRDGAADEEAYELLSDMLASFSFIDRSAPAESGAEQPTVTVPQPHAKIANPLYLEAAVPRSWLFEQTVYVEVYDANETLLGLGAVPKKGEHDGLMTVSGRVPYRTSDTSVGTIRLYQANLSERGASDAFVDIPILF